MERNKAEKGIALVIVLMVSILLLILLMTTLTLSSRNALYMANHQDRTQALIAAEAGILGMISHLESLAQPENEPADTVKTGELTNSRATWKATLVKNNLSGPDRNVIVQSTGTKGSFARTVRAVLKRSASGFTGLGCNGPLLYSGNNFINGLRSLDNPQPEKGWMYANSDSGIDTESDGGSLYCKGSVGSKGDAKGSYMPGWSKNSSRKPDKFPSFNKNDYPSPDNEKQSTQFMDEIKGQSAVTIDENVKVKKASDSDKVTINGNLKIQNGKIFWVEGDLDVKGSIEGRGIIIVEGNVSFKGGHLDRNSEGTGVVVYAEKDLVLAHPTVDKDESGNISGASTDVSDFFARMPDFAAAQISSGLPCSEEEKKDFFGWFSKSYSDDPANRKDSFNQWWDGVSGDPANPGLPKEVKDWLKESREIPGLSKWQTQNMEK
jgi:hypothetical protein